ncbi:MAG: hypothetical protein AAGF85_19180 [Bacteroidota bacterium]
MIKRYVGGLLILTGCFGVEKDMFSFKQLKATEIGEINIINLSKSAFSDTLRVTSDSLKSILIESFHKSQTIVPGRVFSEDNYRINIYNNSNAHIYTVDVMFEKVNVIGVVYGVGEYSNMRLGNIKLSWEKDFFMNLSRNMH